MRIGKGPATEATPQAARPAKPIRAVSRPTRSRPSGGSFVGLDIGTQTIKAVEVKGAGNALTVTALAMVNTPPGLIQGGMIVDPKALGAVVKNLCGKNGIRSGRVISAAAGADAVVVRVIEVPKMTPAELAETMKWEIERHIPFAANDVELSYQPIDDPATIAADSANPNMEVLLAVARRDMVSLHLDTLQAAGLKPVAIDIEALAVGRALIDLNKHGLATKNVVIVNIGAALTEVGVFKSGLLRFPRIIPMAGDNITRAISDGLGISMEDAEDEKRQNATILMEMLGRGAVDADPFGDNIGTFPGGGGAPMRSPFDVPAMVAPPVFNAYVGTSEPEVTPPIPDVLPVTPTANDPFAAASSFDPFGNPVGEAHAFDLGDDTDASGDPIGVVAAPPVPVRDDPQYRRQRDIFDAILPVLGELSMEIHRSIDYFRSRYPTDTVDQIILCGGSASLGNLDQYIQQEMGVPTVVANPFSGLNVTSKQFSPTALAAISPAFAVAVGLAARDAILGTGG